jgi:hypothetical protein
MGPDSRRAELLGDHPLAWLVGLDGLNIDARGAAPSFRLKRNGAA